MYEAIEEAERNGVWYTPVTWVYCRSDGRRRLLPVFNSVGQRIIRL